MRDWKDTLYYEGMHKPLHAKTPDFLGLFNAIAKRYPNLDFTILFTNFGDSYINHKNIVFSNIETGDVDDIFLQASSWSEMFGRLGINLA